MWKWALGGTALAAFIFWQWKKSTAPEQAQPSTSGGLTAGAIDLRLNATAYPGMIV